MAGSVQVLAHQFQGKQAAFAHIEIIPMAILLGVLTLLGVLGCLCVPTLPGGFPERKFNFYSWMAATKGDGLVVEDDAAKDGSSARTKEVDWKPRMDVEDIQEKFGPKQIRCRNL
jgi:hypothetical protein